MQSDYEKTYKTYKELILEVVDTHLLLPADYPYWQEESPDYSYWRERYKEVKNPWGDIGVECVGVERIKDIDEEFREVVDRLTCTKRTFFGYDMGHERLVRNWHDVAGWIDNIKSTQRLAHHSDIKTAIYKEMARHEKENGLVLETPGAEGGDKTNQAEGKPALLSVETTLFYHHVIGKFSFNGKESLPIFKSPRARVKDTAQKLMRWWEKGKPCPMSEFVKDTTKKTPQWVYDETSKISGVLRDIGVNMPSAISAGYPPPGEPQNFHTES